MQVLKFGGSSVANTRRIKGVVEIVSAACKKDRTALVFSAFKGVTDLLIQAAHQAELADTAYHDIVENIRELHFTTINQLFTNANKQDNRQQLKTKIKSMLDELETFLHGVELIRECSPRILDLVMSFGERLSCTIISQYLITKQIDAKMVDAREIIMTDNNYARAAVLYEESNRRIKKYFSKITSVAVITGFIGASREGVTTTLGRNGSDFTASIIGAALGARVIEIWTDVDGVLSADPRVVKNAFCIAEISYQEAMELSYFGAKVIHPSTMIPAVEKNIPISIKNTFHPQAPGTVIRHNPRKHRHQITGIASIEDVALLNIEGGGMIGVPGTAARAFNKLAKAHVNIIMISQASSEHSICLVLREDETQKALSVLQNEFFNELKANKIENIDVKHDVIVVAVIGENMRGTPGIAGKLFNALGNNKINVLAIAQGSSERNISFVIKQKDKNKALNTIHDEFLIV
jgi:aspartokinase/homoserine dehydrogenase 1